MIGVKKKIFEKFGGFELIWLLPKTANMSRGYIKKA
jgi:hypothetical protein